LDDGHGGRDVEGRERLAAAGFPKARFDGVLVDVGAIRRVPDRQPTVGDLGGLLDALWTDRGDVDRDLPAVDDALQRLAEPGRARAAVRNLVLLALVLERPLAPPDLS